MTEKRYTKKVDDVDSTIIDITENGNDFAWFLSDDITDKQVDKVVQRLNEQYEEIQRCERDREAMFARDSHALLKKDGRIAELNKKNELLKKENQNLRFEMGMYEQKIEDLENENL